MPASGEPRTFRNWVWLGVTILLALWLGMSAVEQLAKSPGPDLYHPWAIALPAQSMPASSPYAAASQWGDVLNRKTLEPGSSAKLAFAGRYWQMRTAERFEPTATPFYYAVFGFLPSDYDRAQLVWVALQYLALGFAVYVLARLQGMGRLPALCTIALVGLVFQPFRYDVAVANANTFQLAFLAAIVGLGARYPQAADGRAGWVCLALVIAVVAFKPNMLWVAAALVVHYWATWGTARLRRAALRAAPVLPLTYCLGAWYFHDFAVWRQWLEYIGGGKGGTIFYSIEMGNHALAQLLHEKRGGAPGPVLYSMLIAIALGIALFVAAAAGREPRSPRSIVIRLFGDAPTAASIGVVLTLAAAPLIWYHYFVWALVPIFCIFRRDRGWDAANVFCAAAFAAMSMPVLTLASKAPDPRVLYLVQTFPWVLLIPAMLAHVRRAKESAST